MFSYRYTIGARENLLIGEAKINEINTLGNVSVFVDCGNFASNGPIFKRF